MMVLPVSVLTTRMLISTPVPHCWTAQRLTNLHSTAETKDKVKSRLFLDVVVGKGSSILELLAGEDKALLIRWDALLILNLRFDIVDGV